MIGWSEQGRNGRKGESIGENSIPAARDGRAVPASAGILVTNSLVSLTFERRDRSHSRISVAHEYGN
jgi:hypothetical protein